MSDHDQTASPSPPEDEKLETMLRRWGADEAVGRTTVGDAPPVDVAPRRQGLAFWRWAPIAAGFLLFVLGTVMFLVGTMRQFGTAMDEASPLAKSVPSETEIRLANHLGQTLEELRAAQEALETARSTAAEEMAALEGKIAELQLNLEREQLSSATAASEHKTEKDLMLLAATELRGKVTDAEAKLATARDALRNAHTGGAQGRAQLAEAVVARRRVEKELAESTRRRTAMLALVRDVVIDPVPPRAAAAAGATVLGRRIDSLRRSVRDNRLLARGAGLRRRAADDAETVTVIDAVDAVLTQLDLVDTRDVRAVRALVATVGRADVVSRLDQALRTADLGDDLTQWLIETRLVLTGVIHAI